MTKRILATILVSSVILPMTALAQTGSDFGRSQFKTRTRKPTAADLLLKPVERVDWEDTTLEDVFDWFRAESEDQINVLPRWNALAVVGVDADSSVSLKLTDTNIAEVLNEVLDQLSIGGGLGYQAKGNTLRISTRADFGRKLEVRAYEIRDLVFYMPDFGQSFPAVDLQAAARSGGSGGGGGGQSIFGGSSSQSQELQIKEQEINQLVDDLVTIIATTIEPASWGVIPTGGSGGAAGGTGPGTIRRNGTRSLIIYNTIEVHEMIAGYFVAGR